MKSNELRTLKEKADRLASRYIRQKHQDENGNIKCVSCEKVIPWKESHCAHFVERTKTPLRWLEENLWPSCASCNVYRKEFHLRNYTKHMIDYYGREFVDQLERDSRKTLSPTEVRTLAEEAIEYYGNKIKENGYEI